MKEKSVVLIGGGVQEVEAVRIAKKAGYRVIVLDRNSEAPCFELADKTAVINGTNQEGLSDFVISNKDQENIVAVFTLTELVESVAFVSNAAGLPGASTKSAQICQDKARFKKAMIKDLVPTPAGFILETYEEAIPALEDLGGAAFIKPVVGFGGKGGRRIEKQSQLEDYFKDYDDGPLLMEELTLGTMHDVNAVFDADGIFHLLGCFDRFFSKDYPVEIGARYPSLLHASLQSRLGEVTEQAARAVGITSGPVKADLVMTGQEVKILEMAPRLHGPKGTLFLSQMASGVSHLETMLKVLTGDLTEGDLVIEPQRSAAYQALLSTPGRIKEVNGIGKAEALEAVEKVMLLKGVGDLVPEHRDSRGVPCYVFATGATDGQARAVTEDALSLIDFVIRDI